MVRLPHSQQSGIALVAVLVIVAIVSLITLELAMGQRLWFSHAQNLNDRTQAEWVRRGAQDFASMILDRDKLDGETDHLNENWASKIPPFPAEGGQVHIRIEDLQGRFNLNSLLKNGQYNTEYGAVFRRLIKNAEISKDIQNSILDWIDADTRYRNNGAEDNYYMNLESGYRTPNQPLHTIRDLVLIKGIEAEDFEKLESLVTALPMATKININTAPAAVLASLFKDMTVKEAEGIVEYRKNRPFSKISDIMKAVSGSYIAPKDTVITTGSQYFKISTAVEFGRYYQHTGALLHRPAGAEDSYFFYHDRPLITIVEDEESE